MSRTLLVASVFSLFSLCVTAGAQSNQSPNSNESKPPSVQLRYRPKLSLQEALKIAEGYIEEKHIDIGPFWLQSAGFNLVGDENTPDEKKIPCWHFVWVNDNNFLGDYVEIIVTMDGYASRAPSM